MEGKPEPQNSLGLSRHVLDKSYIIQIRDMGLAVTTCRVLESPGPETRECKDVEIVSLSLAWNLELPRYPPLPPLALS